MKNSCSFQLPHSPILLTLGLLSFLVFSCTEVAPGLTLNGTWKYTHFENTETGEIASEPTYIARSIILTFEDNGKKGVFYGQTVTNSIQGKYKIEPNGSISFSDIAGGLRGEPDWAETFWEALDSAVSFAKDTEGLEISFQEGKRKLLFVPE